MGDRISAPVDVLRKQNLSWTNATRVEQGTERANSGAHVRDQS